MKRLIAAIGDVLSGIRAVITGHVSVEPPTEDPYVVWLRDQQQAAVEARKRRRNNFIEQELLRTKRGGSPR